MSPPSSTPDHTPSTGAASTSLPITVQGKSSAGVARAPACTLVIFGAAGDLTKRLLIPSIYNLAGSHLLDDAFQVIGIDHSAGTDEAWRSSLTDTLQSFAKDPNAEFHPAQIDDQAWSWVRERLTFVQGDFEDPATYAELNRRLSGNVIFYLAVAARFFGPIVDHLGQSGLLTTRVAAFRRVVIEKPFGHDLASAQALNQQILASGSEDQFYRIDHFLGKDAVQSILAVRFANTLFEPIWRREYVDHVQITAAETIGVEARGAFYEPTGALRDMVPNHLVQLLCMTAMDAPSSFDADAVRSSKAALLRAARPVDPADAVRGQYVAGQCEGMARAGYREEAHVAPDSRTETYVALKVLIDNWRWAGVPFYLRTGKRMTAHRTEIAIHLKDPPASVFRRTGQTAPSNVIRLQLDPSHGISSHFNVKVPGPVMALRDVSTHFQYAEAFDELPNVGYETLLYDCLMGDTTSFQRADTIEAGWAIVQPALDAWQTGEPAQYACGDAGPAEADELLRRDGRQWDDLAP